MTIGCYTFVNKDWERLEQPLDLWLKHHADVFDEIALIRYGKFDLPALPTNVVTKIIDEPTDNNMTYYIKGYAAANELLATDWRVMLSPNEFMKRVDTENWNPDRVFPVRMMHLYGDTNHILKHSLPIAHYRIHHVDDSGFFIDSNNVAATGTDIVGNIMPISLFDPTVWSMQYAKNHKALQLELIDRINREVGSGNNNNLKIYQYLNTATVNYIDILSEMNGARRVKLRDRDITNIPKILLDNKSRFEWMKL